MDPARSWTSDVSYGGVRSHTPTTTYNPGCTHHMHHPLRRPPSSTNNSSIDQRSQQTPAGLL